MREVVCRVSVLPHLDIGTSSPFSVLLFLLPVASVVLALLGTIARSPPFFASVMLVSTGTYVARIFTLLRAPLVVLTLQHAFSGVRCSSVVVF